MKTLRPAFTIIEVLVSVVILSGAILYTLQIHTQNRQQIIYLSERNKHSLQDSLFLTSNAVKYHKETKDAYTLLRPLFTIDSLEAKELLKKTSRDFFIPEQVIITPPEGTIPYQVFIDEINIKSQYPSTYFHFQLK